MPKVRVHNFTISLDGYGAGPKQDRDNPLGVGGEALHDWLVATRTFHQMAGKDGGTTGIDDDFAARFAPALVDRPQGLEPLDAGFQDVEALASSSISSSGVTCRCLWIPSWPASRSAVSSSAKRSMRAASSSVLFARSRSLERAAQSSRLRANWAGERGLYLEGRAFLRRLSTLAMVRPFDNKKARNGVMLPLKCKSVYAVVSRISSQGRSYGLDVLRPPTLRSGLARHPQGPSSLRSEGNLEPRAQPLAIPAGAQVTAQPGEGAWPSTD